MDRRRAAVARRALLLLPVLAFLALVFLYPLASIVDLGLRPHGDLELGAVTDVLGDPGIRHVIGFTVAQAAGSTLLTLAIGLPAAYALARFRFRGRALIRALTVAPFALPTVVVGTAFVALLGDEGPVSAVVRTIAPSVTDLDRTIGALLLAHAFMNVAVVVLIVGAALTNLDPSIEEAAAVLGASRMRAAWSGALAAVRSSIATAATLVFLFTFTSFGVVLTLAGPTRATIEVEIYRQTSELLNLPAAAVLSLVQLTMVVALLIVVGRVHAGRRSLSPRARVARPPSSPGERAFVVVAVGIVLLVVVAPLGVLLARTFVGPAGLTLTRFAGLDQRAGGILAVTPWQALANSLWFAAGAALIAFGLGLCAAAAMAGGGRGSRAASLVLTLPLGVSAVTVGFGAIVAFGKPPFDLRGSLWLVPMTQALVAIPFVVRVVTPALREADAAPREAAAVLGAGPWRARREVVLPIVWRTGLLALALAFVVAIGEFGATVFVARLDHPTVPIAIARLLSQPGAASVGQAMAMSTLLAAITVAAVLTIERIRPGGLGRF
jgi:thiamine transport system permease protein